MYQVRTVFLGESSSECYTDKVWLQPAGRHRGELPEAVGGGRWEGGKPAPDPEYRLSTPDRLPFLFTWDPDGRDGVLCTRCQHFLHDNSFIAVPAKNSLKKCLRKLVQYLGFEWHGRVREGCQFSSWCTKETYLSW